MNPKKISINPPIGYVITKNVLTDYNPIEDFTEDNNLYYLQEDLFQMTNESIGITIDLGWYGDIINNKGIFKIYVIKNYDWDNPLNEIESKSIQEIHKLLINVIKEQENKASA